MRSKTDAAINPGGPLVDMQGRIVGLNSSIASLGGGLFGGQTGSIGLGFALTITQAKRIADQLIATGHATRATLGVTAKPGTPTGAVLVAVAPGSAAAKAGLQPGDVITKVGIQLITDATALPAAINSAAPGATVTLTLTSGAGPPHTQTITLDTVPAT